MASAAAFMSFTKLLNSSFSRRQFAALHASGQRFRLIAQSGLNAGEKLGRFGGRLLRRCFIALMLPGLGDDFLLALGNVVLVLLASAATTASATGCLGLREFPLERIGLDEGDVRARFCAGVFGNRVEAHHIAGHQLEILEGKHGGTIRLFHALLLEQIDRLLGAAVDRVMKRHVVEAKLIVRLDRDGDLFDGAGAVVMPGRAMMTFGGSALRASMKKSFDRRTGCP